MSSMMSLVDYTSSSGSEDEDEEEIAAAAAAELQKDDLKIADGEREEEKKDSDSRASFPPPPDLRHNQNFITSSSHQPCNSISPLPSPQTEKLPDVSLLFSSPSLSSYQTILSDHSRVAAATVASRSQKRESNGSSSAYPHCKLPRGPLPHSRNVLDTVGNQLIPPQLRGRSNVVTEDISKLFVRKDGQNLPRRN